MDSKDDSKMRTLASNHNDFVKTRENIDQSQREVDTKDFLEKLPDDQLQNLKIYVDYYVNKYIPIVVKYNVKLFPFSLILIYIYIIYGNGC
jgi:hypothetical protein